MRNRIDWIINGLLLLAIVAVVSLMGYQQLVGPPEIEVPAAVLQATLKDGVAAIPDGSPDSEVPAAETEYDPATGTVNIKPAERQGDRYSQLGQINLFRDLVTPT
ncbi:hypothetical protein HQ520_16990, partial [bacterium]|nr:hypothetical protein [bacterium]